MGYVGFLYYLYRGPKLGGNGPPEISFDSDINKIYIIGLYDKIRKIPKIS